MPIVSNNLWYEIRAIKLSRDSEAEQYKIENSGIIVKITRIRSVKKPT